MQLDETNLSIYIFSPGMGSKAMFAEMVSILPLIHIPEL